MEVPAFPTSPSDAASQVRDLLQSTGWTQGRLAHEMGVTQPTVSRWLSGKQEPSFQQAMGIAYYNLRASIAEIEKDTSIIMILGSVDHQLEITTPPKAKGYKAKLKYGIKGPHIFGFKIVDGARTPFGEDGSIVICALAEKNVIHSSSYYVSVLEDRRIMLRKLLPGTTPGLHHLVAPGLNPILDADVSRPFVVIGTITPDAVYDAVEVGPDEYEFAY